MPLGQPTSPKGSGPVGDPHPLSKVQLFSALSSAEIAEMVKRVQRRRFRRGETIFHEGDVGTALFIVEAGEVKIVLRSADGKEVLIGFRKPGDFFGEMALLDGEPRSTDAIATEPSSLLILWREEFLRFLIERPQVAVDLLAILSRRLRSTTRLVQDAAFLNVRARLVKVLLELAESKGIPGPEAEVTIPRLTQLDLAAMVSATRESVNKWLRYYERLGMVKLRRGGLDLLQPQRLRQEIY